MKNTSNEYESTLLTDGEPRQWVIYHIPPPMIIPWLIPIFLVDSTILKTWHNGYNIFYNVPLWTTLSYIIHSGSIIRHKISYNGSIIDMYISPLPHWFFHSYPASRPRRCCVALVASERRRFFVSGESKNGGIGSSSSQQRDIVYRYRY